ncbi:probable lipid-A-disaccharide synthase, mitochondrial isoform X2 [Ananas comosus]|uniref:lipid-A-disaccharide synthase n=1 Tax=Ananas comosus TaxID=4615 RepID=A0A6P5F1H9_ANACO|nr:probable lipid-A-disaccharide synthase, mitochondrial isoform X2 [Ananas comosus]
MLLKSVASAINGRELRRTLSSSSSPFTAGVRCSSHGRRRVIDVAAKDGELRVFLVAGEVSGDALASRLMASLKNVSPVPVRFAGVGGSLMHKEGLQSIFPMEEIAVMGLWELLPHLNNIRIKLKDTTESAILFQPHVVVTVDSKGFSFRFLKLLQGRYIQNTNSPVHVHYVAPSFWAWKGGETRLTHLRHFVDHILCILPFEEEICRLNGLPATYVGHPLLEDVVFSSKELESSFDKCKFQGNVEAFRQENGLSSESTIITLLPGSRLQEVTRMLPIFLKTVEFLKNSIPELSTIIPVAPNCRVETYINNAIRTWPLRAILIPGESIEKKYEAFRASRAALCTSGSAVMELMLAGLPSVVAYRAHFITECIVKLRTKLNFISLPNILLESAVIPEVLFRACTSDNLVRKLREVLFNDEVRRLQISSAEEVLQILHNPIAQRSNSILDQLGFSSYKCCPSMIAASTVLYAEKLQKSHGLDSNFAP